MFMEESFFKELLEVWDPLKLVKLPLDFQAKDNFGFISYLQNTGLPNYLDANVSDMEFIIDFRDISKGLSCLCELDFGLPNPEKWSDYYVLGDETFCNGSALWVYDINTGGTYRFDVELDEPFWETSTTIETLALSLLSFYYWYKSSYNPTMSWEQQIRILDNLLLKADPELYGSSKGFWYSLINELKNVDVNDDARDNLFVSNVETKPKHSVF